MTWTLMLLVMVLSSVKLSNTMNPVKMSILLMASSLLQTILMYYSSSFTWFPMILYALFMGGILVMFSILSTIMPNEKMKKMTNIKMKLTTLMMMGIFLTMISKETIKNSSGMSSKLGDMYLFLNSSLNLTFCGMLIISYFMFFSVIITMEKNSLRTSM